MQLLVNNKSLNVLYLKQTQEKNNTDYCKGNYCNDNNIFQERIIRYMYYSNEW